ncbi:MAG: acyloxyacyl hydrolase [Chlamydiota bacterium]
MISSFWQRTCFLFAALSFCLSLSSDEPKKYLPSHLMVGPGIFDVDQDHPRAMGQIEYRWQIRNGRWRPLTSFFITTDGNFFICGGIGYDIRLGRRLMLTPSFSPGLYYHAHGKNLGFPINFRSAMDLAYVFNNKGRIGAQFNHISNARMLRRNPGADSLFIYYAIPIPQ